MVSNAEGSTTAREQARPEHHSSRVKPRMYSGQGATLQNLILFVGGMVTIVVSFLLFASYPNSPWLFFIGILVYGVALMVPTLILPSRTKGRTGGGTDLGMHLPAGPEEMAARRSIEH